MATKLEKPLKREVEIDGKPWPVATPRSRPLSGRAASHRLDQRPRHALEHIAKVCKADPGPSSGIDFARIRKAA
jgi:hypothetical protein